MQGGLTSTSGSEAAVRAGANLDDHRLF